MTRGQIVAALAAFPARLTDVARAFADADRLNHAGEWGPNEVIRHLIAVELEVHQSRLHDLATSEEPQWVWAEPGPWPGEPERTLDELLDRFGALRAATLATVDGLDDDGWSRTGMHVSLGRWDVEGLLQSAIDHDEEHLAALR
ncbi:MAG: DinB family protein [Candidatus Limnocylindrales bacterium]